MAAIRELCLTVLFLLFSLISGLQTNSTNLKACESSNVTIAFKYSLEGDNFLDRSWFINSNTAANRIARVNSAGIFTVGLQYSGRVTLSGSDAITLHNVNKSDSGTYLFVILTAINSDLGTATTTVNVCVNPNNSCIPIIENNSTGNFTCKISDACNGKDCIQAIWDDGSVGMFTCPSVKVTTKYKCCAKGDTATNCYNGSLCTEIECNATDYNCTVEFDLKHGLGTGLSNDIICVICLILIVKLVEIVVAFQAKVELQKPILEGSEVTITASVCGFWISSVHWTGPQGNTLTSDKYKIKYNKKAGISTLKITNLEINDSGLYTCHTDDACGSSAQDSVTISVYEKLAVDIDMGEIFRQRGSDVKMTCSVYGSENKSVVWTEPEEKILSNGARYTIVPYDSNTNKSCLITKTSSMTNAEGYICQVVFKESGVSVKIYIKITVLGNGLFRVIEKIILSVPASENVSKELIGMPEKALTNPASENERREWTGPQDNILTNSGKYTIVPYDRSTNKSHLTVKNVFVNDHGSYTYQAMDSSGSPPKISITIKTNDSTDSKQGASNLILGLCFSIIFVVCIVCIVILVTIDKPCALKLGLGLGLGLGIPFIGCIIVIVILVKKVVTIQAKDELQKPIPEGLEITIAAFVRGFFISSVQWNGPDGNILTSNGKYNIIYNRDTGISILQISALEINDSGLYTCHATGVCGSSAQDSVRISVNVLKPTPTPAPENRKTKSGSRSDVSRNDVEIQMEEKGVKSNEARPPAIHIGTENKVKSETSSKKTNNRPQPSPPVTVITEDIPKHRPQPPPPKNSDVEDRNLRGISANFDDSQGLPTDIPRSSRLPPLTLKQPTVEEEDASEKPRQRKNKKKKKGKVKQGNPEEEMVELKSKRKLPEDQSDED